MGQVPLYSLAQTILEGMRRLPSKFRAQFFCIDGVAKVMPGAIFDESDKSITCTDRATKQFIRDADE